jgi:hypothetical protein
MKVNETITLTHEVPGSAGYEVYPVVVDKLALIDITTEPPATKLYGAPGERHFTFLAVEDGDATVQCRTPRQPSHLHSLTSPLPRTTRNSQIDTIAHYSLLIPHSSARTPPQPAR